MILSGIVLLFCLGMAVLWATYGLFSALIHLLCVIAAGAVAFAVWEPLTAGLLINFIPDFAWAVGLLVPFAAALAIFRVATDKLVPANMNFPGLVNQVLGGAVGAVIAVLTAGITLIGVAYLPLPLSLLGYQPYQITPQGTVAEVTDGDNLGKLWLPVDRWTVSFYDYLSLRGFASARPLAQVHPDLFQEAGSFRLVKFYDEHATQVAQPDNVKVTEVQVFTEDLPEGLDGAVTDWLSGQAPNRAGAQVVTVGTTWENPKGNATYDSDSILRVPPYQVQLLATVGDDPTLQRYMPVGWSKPSDVNVGRDLWFVNTNQSMASNIAPPADIAWVYAIPDNAEPKFITIRGLRFELPDPEANNAEQFLAAVGAPFVQDDDGGGNEPAPIRNPAAAERIGDKIGGYTSLEPTELEQTAALPRSVSPNDATGLDIEDGVVRSGKDTTSTRGRSTVSARAIDTPESLRSIRLNIRPSSLSDSPVGTAVAGGTTEADIWLESDNGKQFFGVAYVLLSGQEQTISVESIRRSTDVPLNQFKDGDTLYLFYRVPPRVKLTKFHFGDAAHFVVDYTVTDEASIRR